MESSAKSVVVIGGSSGLGKVIANRYRDDGFQVAIVSRTKPAFAGEKEGFRHFSTDLSIITAESAGALVNDIVSQTGRPSYLVFCQRYRGTERNLANELFVAVSATEILVGAFVPQFAKTGDKAIVTVSSVYADYVGSSQPLSYHVVKAGLNALIRYYAVTLGSQGIRSNAISPLTFLKDESKHVYLGDERTLAKYRKLTPLGRMPLAEECANVLRFLGSEQASFVNGQIIYVDGGVSTVWPEEFALN